MEIPPTPVTDAASRILRQMHRLAARKRQIIQRTDMKIAALREKALRRIEPINRKLERLSLDLQEARQKERTQPKYP